MSEAEFAALRRIMLVEIAATTIFATAQLGKASLDRKVLEIMGRVPRHEFVPIEIQQHAYANTPLPIGYGKTISQPFIVAAMTDLLQIAPTDKVLEIGTGAGYQAAILAELADTVYSIEIIEELAVGARRRLAHMGYTNIEIKVGDGSRGWPDFAPYDKVIVTAAPDLIPPALMYQLKPGGRMVIPAGLADEQQLILVEKDLDGRTSTRDIMAVRFSQLESAD